MTRSPPAGRIPGTATPHTMNRPSPPAPLPSDGRGWRELRSSRVSVYPPGSSWTQRVVSRFTVTLSMNLSPAGARAFQPAANQPRRGTFARRCGQECPRAVPARGSWSPCVATRLPSLLPMNQPGDGRATGRRRLLSWRRGSGALQHSSWALSMASAPTWLSRLRPRSAGGGPPALPAPGVFRRRGVSAWHEGFMARSIMASRPEARRV